METVNLKLPLLEAGQAQKHVTINEALARIDAAVQARVLDRDLAAPPGAPDEGDAYLVAAAATGAWSGHEGKIAFMSNGVWDFMTAEDGWIVFVVDETQHLVRRDGVWLSLFSDVAMLGVNTSPDSLNRLAVRSNAVLLTAIDDADGGTGAMQVKVNKEAAGDTASHMFQTGFSGRAEFGLTGDDDFHLKVSADGSAWTEALVVDRTNGEATMAGALNLPAGVSSASPGLRVGGWRVNASSGLQFGDADGLPIATISGFGLNATRFNTGVGGGNFTGGHARGTPAAPTALASGDTLFRMQGSAYTGSAFETTSYVESVYIDPVGGAGKLGTRWAFCAAQNGSASISEIMRIEYNTGLSMYGANKVIDENRNLNLRSFTVAGVPSAATPGVIIYVSNESGGAVPAFSDGTNWRRVTDRSIIA